MALVREFDDHPISEHTAHAARSTIADNASDAADLARLLDMIAPTTHRPGDAS